jgi:hypothetical protein
MHRIAFVGRSEERSDMLSDTRVVSDLIVKSKSIRRQIRRHHTVCKNSFELHAFVNNNAACSSKPVAASSFALRLASIVVVFLHFCRKRSL